jgi:hypothetical protein
MQCFFVNMSVKIIVVYDPYAAIYTQGIIIIWLFKKIYLFYAESV